MTAEGLRGFPKRYSARCDSPTPLAASMAIMRLPSGCADSP